MSRDARRSGPSPLPADVLAAGAALVLAVLLGAAGCRRADPEVGLVLEGPTMGTVYHVRVDDAGAEGREQEISRLIRSTLDDVDAKMSTWKADSEISRFNRMGAGEEMIVSAETFEVLEAARRLGRETGGAFDVTVGPLVDLWGFGPSGSSTTAPPAAEVERAREKVGLDLLELHPEDRTVSKPVGGVEVDLSAIAKGYAVDRVIGVLVDAGLERLMVEVGGEVKTRGRTAEERPWRIGIERPLVGTREVALRIPLVDAALASSGNYRNFIEMDGTTYGHEIDPRTGFPVAHRTRGVSVVTDSCMEADALATALMVMGADRGLAWAVERDLAALFFVDVAGEMEPRATPRFERLREAELQ